MARRLPPLNSLRAFEAAARHLSFAKAAEELHVTPAAVSHQIKALEAHLGTKLFRRMNKAVLLTDAAQILLPGVRDGFDRLAQAVGKLAGRDAANVLSVTVTPSFGARWLVPRLERFRARHPEITVRFDASERLVDFTRDPIDMGVRYGSGSYAGLEATLLIREEVFPVCSPRLLQGPHPLRVPGDLKHQVLIHTDWDARDDTSPDWRMWLLAAGAPDVDPTQGLMFGETNLAMHAAIEGQGVVLSSNVLADNDIAAGRLVRLFDVDLKTSGGFGYYVVAPKATFGLPKIAAFRDWLLAEAKADTDGGAPARIPPSPRTRRRG
jgi:LysR family glycine cleavage system transcriptional activator